MGPPDTPSVGFAALSARRSSPYVIRHALDLIDRTLVYLDVAQLAWLARAPRNERDSFFTEWRACRAELALTFHHLQEIGQLSRPAEIDQRFDLLESFPAVRGGMTTSAQVAELEIRSGLLARLNATPLSFQSFRAALFPVADLPDLRAQTIDMASLLRRMREAHEIGAEAERLSQQARAVGSPKMRARINPDNAAERFAELLDTHFEPGSPKRAIAETIHQQLNHALREEGTLRGALENIFGLRRMDIVSSVPHEDLAMISVFRNQARVVGFALSEASGIPQDVVDVALDALNPYDCPGYALKLAAQRARRGHPKLPVAGDQIDDEHLTFAPYADVLFVDKRTFDFVGRELRRDAPLLPASAAVSLCRAANLADVVAQLRLKSAAS
jgi:hypothetical protein